MDNTQQSTTHATNNQLLFEFAAEGRRDGLLLQPVPGVLPKPPELILPIFAVNQILLSQPKQQTQPTVIQSPLDWLNCLEHAFHRAVSVAPAYTPSDQSEAMEWKRDHPNRRLVIVGYAKLSEAICHFRSVLEKREVPVQCRRSIPRTIKRLMNKGFVRTFGNPANGRPTVYGIYCLGEIEAKLAAEGWTHWISAGGGRKLVRIASDQV